MKQVFVVTMLLIYTGVSAQSEPLKVVTTFSVLGDLVQNVAGDNVDLTVLVGPDADSHNYEPSPADIVTLGDADVIVENGLEFETWLDDLVTSSGADATRVVASDGVEPLPASELEEHEGEEAEDEEHEGEEGEAHEGEDEHGEFDPHVWHDMQNAMKMVETIRAALVETDPANAESYNANAEAYTAELETLDTYIQEQVATVPEARRKLVTSHDTFGYFARRYGFEVVGTVLPVSTEAADPAAGELATLIDEIEATGVPAIFAENVTNPDLLEQVASSSGVMVAPPLYTDALGTPDSSGGTYLEMARYNVDTIVQALGE